MPREAKKGATRDSHIYRVRASDELRDEWEKWCARTGTNSPDALRAAMRQLIRGDMPDVRQELASQAEGQPDTGPKERVEVRLTPSEREAITTRAEAEGCSPQRWIVNCVRASLTHEPQFTMETTKALWQSSYQLRAVGRNLNQIAKVMNESGLTGISTQQIEKLAAYIYEHTEKVAAVQDASLSRWGIQDGSEGVDDGEA